MRWRITWHTHGRSDCTGGESKLGSSPPPIVGEFVFLFFLFFIAGHYLGVLLVFNGGGTACFNDPCR
jgi:hypothetical protein